MDLVRQLVVYAVLVAVLYAVVIAVRHFAHVQVPNSFSDIAGLEEFTSFSVDRTVTPAQLRVGDAVCYYIDNRDDHALCFGWIAGLSGDEIGVAQGAALVNGKSNAHGDHLDLPDLPGIRVPAHHVWVVSDRHASDSFAVGPLPVAAIYGRLAHMP